MSLLELNSRETNCGDDLINCDGLCGDKLWTESRDMTDGKTAMTETTRGDLLDM